MQRQTKALETQKQKGARERLRSRDHVGALWGVQRGQSGSAVGGVQRGQSGLLMSTGCFHLVFVLGFSLENECKKYELAKNTLSQRERIREHQLLRSQLRVLY